jgi:hypothetical protein
MGCLEVHETTIASPCYLIVSKQRESCLLIAERNREESRGVFGLHHCVAEYFRKQMGWSKWFQNAINCQNRLAEVKFN